LGAAASTGGLSGALAGDASVGGDGGIGGDAGGLAGDASVGGDGGIGGLSGALGGDARTGGDGGASVASTAGDAGDARTDGDAGDAGDAKIDGDATSGVGGARGERKGGGARVGTAPNCGGIASFTRLSMASWMRRTTWATLTTQGARRRAWDSLREA